MSNLSSTEEIELLLRFPFSPKVREIVANSQLSKKAEEIRTKHLKESHTPNEINNAFSTPKKTPEREIANDNNSPQTELAKMNARLEGLVYNTPKQERKSETNDLYKSWTPSYSPNLNLETKHLQSANHTPEKEQNILEKADRQLLKSRALFSSNIYSNQKRNDEKPDLLKGEDLKSSHLITGEDLYESQISPEVVPILEEVKAMIANSGAEEKKEVAKALDFEQTC